VSALEALIPVAVVGTARRGHGDLADAEDLLAAAARAVIKDRVALPAGAAVADPGPEPETLPAPDSPFYVGTLQQAMGGRRWPAVLESLRFLAETNQRLPVGVLHALLEEAVTLRELRPELFPVLGARGRWLAARNPRWRFAEWSVPDVGDDRAWAEGDPVEQVAWLRALREIDPARARTLLAARLPAVPPAERCTLLGALGTGLSADDERLLESMLDNRAPTVRASARELLAQLPGSAFVARMQDRLRARARIIRGRWTVDFQGLTPADARDGVAVDVRERPPGAAAMRALTGGVPLDTWPHVLNRTPIDVLRLAADQVELGPLPGLRDAAVREGDAEVAHAILGDARWPLEAELLGLLTAEDADQILSIRVLMDDPNDVIPVLRARGFGRETARALLVWSFENRNQGRRAAILSVLGDHGPLDTEWTDLAVELRHRADTMTGGRSDAFDAAMTINLRRALRLEATPPFARQPLADQEPS
jgi:hypothetical protein